jgi:hypothetical protein
LSAEEYGFRWGAFLASMVCLGVGLAMSFGAQARDPLWYGVAAVLIAAFVLSAWGSSFWSDRPVQGLRRLAANVQLALLALFVVIITAWVSYVFVSILVGLAAESPWRLLGIVVAVAILSVIVGGTRQGRTADDDPRNLVDVVANAYRQVALHLFGH